MILLVDDQPEVSDYVARILRRRGYKTDAVDRPDAALARLEDAKRRYSLAIFDLDLGGGAEEGLDLLRRAREVRPELPLLVLTGKGTVDLAVRALKIGAEDFLEKDIYIEDTLGASLHRVERLVEVVERSRRLEKENADLRRTAAFVREIQHLKYRPIGESPAFLDVLERAGRLASIPRPVLVLGERGSGKELVAAAIHYAGDRRGKPFIKVNCAAMSGTLLESEMFGHEKGAFTGANQRRLGRFELADGGTLLLDEVGNMSAEFQGKVLRVIEYQEFVRVGGQKPVRVDVRVIAATNADLKQRIEEGTFRADLYDRLSFEVLRVPPLRERPEDIPLLATHFADRFAAEVKLQPRTFSEAAMAGLCAYRWPGNVRELKNVVERLVFSARTDQIELPDLPPEVREGPAASGRSFPERLVALEREMLEAALSRSSWNQKKAAAALGLTYDQLRHYYRKHGLSRPE